MHFGVRLKSGARQKVAELQKITATFNQGGTWFKAYWAHECGMIYCNVLNFSGSFHLQRFAFGYFDDTTQTSAAAGCYSENLESIL